jgi:DNA polymerase-3 subunit gamma/tau
MSYQVLARKWRPRNFSEMVGQEHVLRALINALDNERLHHAYLFTGTRGVGKTTIARILAKCLNCEQGVSSKPCGECSACTSIAEGRFVDLIEVDAASRTKVEDTRELLENVQYAPTVGRFKVYLIDEVHMLSTHSFNALLKTLEEPPPHVKFLLATTDPQKLPVTILSRCLQFNLKNLSPERIVEHLQYVLAEEQVPNEETGLWALARAADGSMRDALSLTDQAIAHGGGKLTESEVSTMLGTIDLTAIADIARALVNNDGAEVLAVIQAMSEHAPDYSAALADLLSVWHRVAIAQTVPDALDNRHGDYQLIQELAKALSREDVQLYYQICLLGRRDLPMAPNSRTGFEMVMLRMLAFQPVRESRIDPPVNAIPVDHGDSSNITGGKATGEAEELTKKPEAVMAESAVCADAVVADSSVERGSKVDGTITSQEVIPASDEPPSLYTDEDYPELQHGDSSAISGENEYLENNPGSPSSSSAHSEDNQIDCDAAPSANGGKLSVVELMENHSAQDVAEAIGLEETAEQVCDSHSDEVIPVAVTKLSLAQIEPKHWIEVYQGLSVGGVLQNIAANLALVEVNGDTLYFELDKDHSSLYEENHRARFAQVLADYFGQPVNVEIAKATVTQETPQAHRLRIKAERQQAALDSLNHDPGARRIMDVFDGVLLEKTVKPID